MKKILEKKEETGEESEDDYIKLLRHGMLDDVKTEQLLQFREFDRQKVPVSNGHLDQLKQEIKQSKKIVQPLILAVDMNTREGNLHDGNHRLTIANELGMKWVPLRVIKFNNHRDDVYPKLFYCPREWPTYACPCDFGFTTKKNKFGKTRV